MLDLLGPLAACLMDDTGPQPCAVATLVGTQGSTGRAVGTSMLVTAAGDVTGSLCGGCIEGAVFEACRLAIASGLPGRERYGFSPDEPFSAGLPCGGAVEVLIQPFYPTDTVRKKDFASFAAAARSPAAALIRRIDNTTVSAIAVENPRGFDPEGLGNDLLAMVGVRSVARSAARLLGYRVVLCDARPVFAPRAAFQQANSIPAAPCAYRHTTRSLTSRCCRPLGSA